MGIDLPTDLKELVRRKVAAGDYATEDDVVRAALQLLDERDRKLAELRIEIDKGLASGPGREIPMREIIDRVRRRMESA